MSAYKVRPLLPDSETELNHLPPLTRHLLFHRGIKDREKADAFLAPDYIRDVHDPYLLKDMDRAVARILRAIEADEKIVIYSDYDADGIPGAVVLHDFFKKVGFSNFGNYIPHRHLEGFGVHMEAVEDFSRNGVKLLMTIDCGIADVAEVKKAQELGIDVIVTDHHLPENGNLPPAYAILNPKQADCNYPEKMLCGAGVVFKLVQALADRIRSLTSTLNAKPYTLPQIGWEKWLLDMVGIATLSDMVPLTGENRVFAHYGLKVLRKSPRVGLMKLLRELKTDQRQITEDDIGFTISPRINAASRMGLPMDAFRLLATTDEVEAGELASHLNTINDERKGLVASMVKEVRKIVSERGAQEKKVIVLGNPKWRPALLGLVANALMDDYRVPVFIWGREEGATIKGSCRSDGSVSVVDLMRETSGGVFVEYGGHALSGGFSVVAEKVHILEEEISRAYEKVRTEKLSEEIFIDKELSIDDVNWELYRQVEVLAPFGLGNPKPLFIFRGALLFDVRAFGKEGNHLELVFKNAKSNKVSAIDFFTKREDFKQKLSAGERVNLVATMEKSNFRNFPELRLRIVDII